MVSRKIRKLKHLALRSIYYRLLNTSCIFTYNRWRYCKCDQFQGCPLKPIHGGLLGEKNYCYVCHVGVTYDVEKIENLIKIADVNYNFCAMKKDIQLCIDFDSKCDKLWMYHYRKSWRTGFDHCKWTYLKNYIDDYMICWNDK